jgi:flagellar assembly factor FliW
MTDTLTVETSTPERVAERFLTFERPIIGFNASRRFSLVPLGDEFGAFSSLASLDEEGLSFIVVPPGALFSDYVIEIPDADVALLALTSAADVEVLALVTRHQGGAPSVNLMGPIVVNRRTNVASQVVLQDGLYAVAVPVGAPSARSVTPEVDYRLSA